MTPDLPVPEAERHLTKRLSWLRLKAELGRGQIQQPLLRNLAVKCPLDPQRAPSAGPSPLGLHLQVSAMQTLVGPQLWWKG